jgi:2-haloacid dehalogenase
VYQAAAAAFGLAPAEVMMVAAHSSDLLAASATGMKSGFIARIDEHGPGRGEAAPDVEVDLYVASLTDLAHRLGA